MSAGAGLTWGTPEDRWHEEQRRIQDGEDEWMRIGRFSELTREPAMYEVRDLYFGLLTVLGEVYDPRHVEHEDHDATVCSWCLAVEAMEQVEGLPGIPEDGWKRAIEARDEEVDDAA